MTKPALLLVLAALCGCAPAKTDMSADPMLQTIIPICGGTHVVSVDSSHAVAQVRSECRNGARPE